MSDDRPDSAVAVSIVGQHEFARLMRAIKAIMKACDIGLSPARRIVDAAREGQSVTFDARSGESAEALANELASIGWVVSTGGSIWDHGPPEPPDWYMRLKGYASVVRSVNISETTLRLVVQARQCELAVGDELVIVMQENLPLGAAICALHSVDEGVQVDLGLEDAESVELLSCLFAPGEDLEVLSAAGS